MKIEQLAQEIEKLIHGVDYGVGESSLKVAEYVLSKFELKRKKLKVNIGSASEPGEDTFYGINFSVPIHMFIFETKEEAEQFALEYGFEIVED